MNRLFKITIKTLSQIFCFALFCAMANIMALYTVLGLVSKNLPEIVRFGFERLNEVKTKVLNLNEY